MTPTSDLHRHFRTPAAPGVGFELSSAWTVLATERYRAEVDVLGAVLADPAGGVIDARDACVTIDSFYEDDTALIFAVVQIQAADPAGFTYDRRQRRRDDTARWDAARWRAHFDPLAADRAVLYSLTRLALQREHHWHPDTPANPYESVKWSEARLTALFGLWPFGAVGICAARLLSVRRRQRGARDHLKQAGRLLRGED